MRRRDCSSHSQPEHCFHPRQLHTVDGFVAHYDWCCYCYRTPAQIEEEQDSMRDYWDYWEKKEKGEV